MSLDVYLEVMAPCAVFERNITHNLTEMADHAGLYVCLWRPEGIDATKAEDLIEPLKAGLEKLKADPEGFKKYSPSNGWGTYEGLVAFVEAYLKACIENPDADVRVSR